MLGIGKFCQLAAGRLPLLATVADVVDRELINVRACFLPGLDDHVLQVIWQTVEPSLADDGERRDKALVGFDHVFRGVGIFQRHEHRDATHHAVQRALLKGRHHFSQRHRHRCHLHRANLLKL